MKSTFSILELYQKDPEAFIWWQVKEAKKAEQSSLPLDVYLKQAGFQNEQILLSTNSHFTQQLLDNSVKLEKARTEIKDIKERYEHYVESEKVTVPNRLFAKIDKLLARLTSLKSRFAETRKYLSNPKQQDNGSK